MAAESVALAIRDHQVGSAPGWQHAEMAREMHRWVVIFDEEFKLALPAYPVIKFKSIRNAYGVYDAGRDEIGTKDTITLNARELGDLPQALSTLCHELLHLWQCYAGAPGQGNYHNKEFCRKAAECGLLVNRRGCHFGHTQRFTDLLQHYGVTLHRSLDGEEPEYVPQRLWGAARRQNKMRKWACDCTNVRCAKPLFAVCTQCSQPFVLVDPTAWSSRGA
jgi:hypothetical protein